jgi:hypothetical protein
MTKNEMAYGQMCEMAEHIGWPAYYKDDLYFHDRIALGLYRIPEPRHADHEIPEGGQFAWLVRETGTWLLTASDFSYELLRYCEKDGPERHRAFWWDGHSWLGEIPLSAVRYNLDIVRRHAEAS